MTELLPTQADRDAAAKTALSYAETENGKAQLRWDIANAKRDGHPLVQAFARHRLSTEAAIVAWLREQGPVTQDFQADLIHDWIDNLADAIEQGAWRQ